MKMEPIVSSETSAIRTQTPGNYPKRNNINKGINTCSSAGACPVSCLECFSVVLFQNNLLWFLIVWANTQNLCHILWKIVIVCGTQHSTVRENALREIAQLLNFPEPAIQDVKLKFKAVST